MKIKTKPKKPVRNHRFLKTLRIKEGLTVQEILHWITSEGLSAKASIEAGYNYGETEYYIKSIGLEPQGVFDARMKEYDKKLAAWNEWYQTNQEAIAAELIKRKEKSAKIAALKRQLKKLQDKS